MGLLFALVPGTTDRPSLACSAVWPKEIIWALGSPPRQENVLWAWEPSPRRRRQGRVIKWHTGESWHSSTLPTGCVQSCYCPKEQVSFSLQAVWAAVPWAKEIGEVSGVIWSCHCGFLTVQKGPGLTKEKAWKEYSYWKILVKFWRYCGCLNQV